MVDLLGPASANAVTSRPTDTRVFDPDDTFFKNCSDPSVQDGTKLDAGWFNGIMQQVRRAIRGMGIMENNSDDDMLLKAIRAAGSTVLYAAASKQPIYPEILAGGVLNFAVSTGQLIINGGHLWQHRGLLSYSSDMFDLAARTFVTSAGKTYHLRWYAPGHANAPANTYPNGRFLLRDLADVGYNPSALAEHSDVFDTTFDDMICARVITSGANALTVVALVNKQTLRATFEKTTFHSNPSGGSWSGLPGIVATINWSRTPQWSISSFSSEISLQLDMVNRVETFASRHLVWAYLFGYSNDPTMAYVSGTIKMEARA